MNRSFFTLLLLCSTFTFLQAQEITVPQTQRPLITKRTASWCPNCGGWGWTFFRNLIDDNKDKAVFFADHYSGDHTTPTSLAIAANFGGVSQPVFFLNNQNQNVTSSNTATARTNFQNQVNTAFATPPVVQSGFLPILNSATNTLTVQAKARFFQNADGEYYLGIYLVRKEYIGFQAGGPGNNAEHKEVLWSHLTPTAFGEPIGNGAIAQGTEVNVNGQLSVAGLDPSKLRVVTVVWKKEGNTFRVINANEEDTFLEPSAADEISASRHQMRIFPKVIQDEARVELDLAEGVSSMRIELIAPSGQVAETIFSGAAAQGTHHFALRRGNYPAGLYFVRLSSHAHVQTQRVILK